jgi:phosphoribosylaminoimidazole (AIR) synthetase
MGIGFIVIARRKDAAGIQAALKKTGMPSYVIGSVIKRRDEKMELA